MMNEMRWTYRKLRTAYNWVVYVPHKESDWKLAIVLGILLIAAIGTHL